MAFNCSANIPAMFDARVGAVLGGEDVREGLVLGGQVSHHAGVRPGGIVVQSGGVVGVVGELADEDRGVPGDRFLDVLGVPAPLLFLGQLLVAAERVRQCADDAGDFKAPLVKDPRQGKAAGLLGVASGRALKTEAISAAQSSAVSCRMIATMMSSFVTPQRITLSAPRSGWSM